MKKFIYWFLAVLVISTLISGCNSNKKNTSTEKTQNSKPTEAAVDSKDNQLKIDYSNPSTDRYKDGVYHGRSSGKGPALLVTVTVKNGKIAQVVVDSHNETKGYSDDAIRITPLRIVAKNSVQVDAVSGVTESVSGICDAVSKALKDAKIN